MTNKKRLDPAIAELIKLLAKQAVEEYLNENEEEKPCEKK